MERCNIKGDNDDEDRNLDVTSLPQGYLYLVIDYR